MCQLRSSEGVCTGVNMPSHKVYKKEPGKAVQQAWDNLKAATSRQEEQLPSNTTVFDQMDFFLTILMVRA